MGAGALTRSVEPADAERQRWLALAEKALAGASFEDKLVSHTDDAIRIEPLYDRAAGALIERLDAEGIVGMRDQFALEGGAG